jgi:hypothetical protein
MHLIQLPAMVSEFASIPGFEQAATNARAGVMPSLKRRQSSHAPARLVATVPLFPSRKCATDHRFPRLFENFSAHSAVELLGLWSYT